MTLFSDEHKRSFTSIVQKNLPSDFQKRVFSSQKEGKNHVENFAMGGEGGGSGKIVRTFEKILAMRG